MERKEVAARGSSESSSNDWKVLVTWSLSLRGKLQWLIEKLMTSLGLVHICLRFGEREESRLYKDLVTILENLHIRRYVSVSTN